MIRSRDKLLINVPDVELLSRYKQSHDQNILAEFFFRYSNAIVGLSLKYFKNQEEARDAAMDIFIELTEKLKNHEISNPKYWLFSVVKNHCLMKLRKNPPFNQISMNGENFSEEIVEIQEEEHLDEVEQQFLRVLPNMVGSLARPQRICIELFYLSDKSYKEIEDITGFDYNSVKSHIQNGKRNLLNKLKNEQTNPS